MNPKIESIVHRIVEQFHPHKVILFGSYARGTATKDSDVDLLVVLPVSGSKKDAVIKIRTSVNGMGIAKDIFVATPEDLKIYKELMGTIIYSALREGKILYEHAA